MPIKYLACGIMVVLLSLNTVVFAIDRIRLTSGEWSPYLSKHLPEYGFASHIVREAFAAVGIQAKYDFYPWKRSFKLARDGVYDGTLVWVYTDERAKDFYYTDVVIQDPEYLFHLKTMDLKWHTIEDLRGLTIGATLHTVYPTLEEAADAGILRIERAGNYENLYRRLIKKRIHAIPQVSQVGKYYLRKTLPPHERKKITYSQTILQIRRYHLILSKKAPNSEQFVNHFNRGLTILHSSGRYGQLLKALEQGQYDN